MGLGNFFKENGGSIAGSAVGAGLNLLGGSISDKNSRRASEASWRANYNAQKEFAQNSIQWRVQDAKKAGINPYAVIGGQTVGYTPQDISQTQDYATGISRAGNALGNMLGQLQLATAKEDLKSKQLDNDKKSVDLANATIKANMGQVPKTITNPISGSIGGELHTDGRGNQTIEAQNTGGIDDPLGMASGVRVRFDRAAHEALAKLNNHHLGLGFSGYETIAPGNLTPHQRAMLDAANYAAKNNSNIKGVAKLLDSYVQDLLDSSVKPLLRHSGKVLKHWFLKP